MTIEIGKVTTATKYGIIKAPYVSDTDKTEVAFTQMSNKERFHKSYDIIVKETISRDTFRIRVRSLIHLKVSHPCVS